MKTKVYFLLLAISVFFVSCNKEPGIGGKATIRGTVIEKHYNSIDDPAPSEYPAANKAVYIIYGDDVTYSDKLNTGPDGQFAFERLRKGSYTIYVYSDDPSFPTNPKMAVMEKVEISEKKQDISIPDLITHKF